MGDNRERERRGFFISIFFSRATFHYQPLPKGWSSLMIHWLTLSFSLSNQPVVPTLSGPRQSTIVTILKPFTSLASGLLGRIERETVNPSNWPLSREFLMSMLSALLSEESPGGYGTLFIILYYTSSVCIFHCIIGMKFYLVCLHYTFLIPNCLCCFSEIASGAYVKWPHLHTSPH